MTTPHKTYRIRFYEPDNILLNHAMDYNSKSNRLAILKKYNSSKPSERCIASDVIELIDCSGHCPNVYQRIYEDDTNPNNLETIAWGPENYFFSAGMTGTINQYRLDNNLIETQYKVDAGLSPIWAIAYHPKQSKLAVATDSGLLKVFTWDPLNGRLDFGAKIGHWETRLLSLAWSDDDTIVTGSIGHIAIWSVSKARCLDKLLLGQGVIVWSLKCYKNIIISGDSNGNTTFWNVETRSKISSVKSHEKDILAVAVSADGIAASSGVDHLMVLFDLKPNIPIKTVHYKLHSHDVKCISFGANDVLYSGGSDSFLGVTDTKKKSRKKAATLFFPDLKRNVQTSGNEILLQYQKRIDGYCLEDSKPSKIFSTTSKYNIILSTFNSSWIIYATRNSLVILERKSNSRGDHFISKVSHDFTERPLSIDLAILVDECKLVVACDDSCFILQLQSNFSKCMNPFKFEDRISSIHPNGRGEFIICLMDGDVYHSSTQNDISLVCSLPSPSLDCASDPSDANTFWFLGPDSSVIKVNVKTKKTEEYNLDASVHLLKCRNICCFNKIVVIYSDEMMFSFSTKGLEYRNCVSNFKHIISLQCNRSASKSDTPLIITELPPEMILEKLPASYERHAGTKR